MSPGGQEIAGGDVISSGTAVLYKVGFLVVFPVNGLLVLAAALFGSGPHELVLALAVALPLAYALCYFSLIDLADEVWDLGNRLRVRRGGKVEEIPLDDVRSVQMRQSSRPGYAIVRLNRRSREFGDSVKFIPRGNASLNPFRGNQVVADLEIRIARRAHHSRSAGQS